MANKTVDLADLSKELKKHADLTVKAQRRVVQNALAQAIPRLVEASPVDTGLYAQSWGFTADETHAVIGNYAPYAAIIEYGARPHMPPLAPLLAWAKRVLQDPSQPPNYSPAVRRLAVGTQMKIAREGSKPRHILENEIPHIIEQIKKDLVNAG
jgi:hypothetical protein